MALQQKKCQKVVLTVVSTFNIVSICHLVFGANFSAARNIPDEQSDLKSNGHLQQKMHVGLAAKLHINLFVSMTIILAYRK